MDAWNAGCSALWNVLRLALARLDGVDLEYFRAVEVQDRGALHLHVIVWSSVELDVDQVHALAVRSGFGCAGFDLSPLRTASRRDVSYVVKYVTKAADQRVDVPWRRVVSEVVNPWTGELEVLTSTDATYRVWSASRGWGITLAAIRELLRSRVTRPADAGGPDALTAWTSPPPADVPEPAT